MVMAIIAVMMKLHIYKPRARFVCTRPISFAKSHFLYAPLLLPFLRFVFPIDRPPPLAHTIEPSHESMYPAVRGTELYQGRE